MTAQDPPEAAHFLTRLDRAVTLFEALRDEWAAYLDQHPHRFTVHVDAAGRGELRVYRRLPLPNTLGLTLGEFLYQLRAALDNCLYAAAIIDSGSSPPPGGEVLQWPICETRAEWRNAQRRVRHLSDGLVTYLESMQPYHTQYPGWNCLRILHDLARIDRHRTLHLAALYPVNAKIWFDRAVIDEVEIHPGVVHHGSVLVSFRYTGTQPVKPEHIDGQFEFELEVADVVEAVGPTSSQPMRPYGSLERRLRAMYDVTGEYMETLIHLARNPESAEALLDGSADAQS